MTTPAHKTGRTAHTSGPWMAAARPSSIVGLPVVATPSGRSIANVTLFSLGEGFKNHDAESIANARLIAAAPDLVNALSGLVDAFVNPADGSPFEEGEVPALDIARAALSASRSTGDQS